MRTYLAAIAIASASAAPALAQDRAPGTFTGAHVEAITGIDAARINGPRDTDTGAIYGLAGGYDVQTAGGTVFGLEGEAADATTKDCARGVVVATDTLCGKFKRDLYVGGRVGFTSGSTLFYGKVGYTNLRLHASYEDGTAATAADFSRSSNLDGVRVGAGVEKNLGGMLVKAEYRYSNYEAGGERHQGVVGLGVRF